MLSAVEEWPAWILRLTWPIRSGGLSIVARWVIEKPLCVDMLRKSWWEGMSYMWIMPVEVPASKRVDVKDIAIDETGSLHQK
jgi:hypothetical protein